MAGLFDLPTLRQKTLRGESLVEVLKDAKDNPAQVRAELAELSDADTDANILFNRAIISAQLGDWESAVEYIDLAFDRRPKEVGIETARAIMYYHRGALQQALTFLRASLRRVKGVPSHSNWVRLGFIHQQLDSTEQALSALYESFLLKKAPTVLLYIAHASEDFSEEMYDNISALAIGRETPELALDISPYPLPEERIEKPEIRIERPRGPKIKKTATLEELGKDLLEHPTYAKVHTYWLEVGRQKAWDTALPVAKTLVDDSPGYPQNHLLLADVYYHLGMRLEAEERIRAALAVAPTGKDKQADVYFQAGARLLSQWGMVKEAVAALRKSYDLEPNPDTALNLALNIRRQAEEDSIQGAIRVLESAKKEFPQHQGVLFHLARLYGDCQDYENAETIYDELLSFTSEPVKVHRDRGLMYKDDNPQKAIQAFEQAISLDDEGDPALYNLLIDAYSSNGELEKALSMADEFISAKGARYGVGLDMYLRKGNLYQRYGKTPEAIAVLNTVRQRGNKTQRYSALMSLGKIYLDDKKDLKRAQEVLEEAADIGLDERVLNLLLRVYEETENFEGAIGGLRKLRDRRPNDPSILDRLGTVLLKAGEVSEGITTFTKALGFQPNDISLLLNLVGAYAKNGQITTAESLLQEVDESSLNMAQRQRLAKIYHILASQYEDDSVDFQKYICISLTHQAASVRDEAQRLALLESAKEHAVHLQECAQKTPRLTEDERREYKRLLYYATALTESHRANQSEPWTDEHGKRLEQAKSSFYGAGRETEGRKYEFLLRSCSEITSYFDKSAA